MRWLHCEYCGKRLPPIRSAGVNLQKNKEQVKHMHLSKWTGTLTGKFVPQDFPGRGGHRDDGYSDFIICLAWFLRFLANEENSGSGVWAELIDRVKFVQESKRNSAITLQHRSS